MRNIIFGFRHLYWTNRDSTVEMSNLDKSNQSVICSNSSAPMGLALDLRKRWIYWLDDRDGISFTLEASSMDKLERRTLLKHYHHLPLSLTLDGDTLFWTDRQSAMVWRMGLE
jgi:hypothetical protein